MSGLNTFGLLALCLIAFSSCRFNPNLQGEGSADLQGIWEEDSIPYQNERLQYSKHEFYFTCDSVYLTIQTFAKTNMYPDSCFNNGRWTEYAKGTYHRKLDTLMISATFTKSNFKQKISGCYRTGQYLPAFLVKESGPGTLHLENLQDHLPLTLSLREKIICTPKPLN